MSLAAEPQGAQRGNAGSGMATPGGGPQAKSTCSATASLAWCCRHGMGSAQGAGKTWRENPALWEVGEEGGLGRVLAPLHALASPEQEEGMALHFNLRSKRRASLLPPGLQRQHDLCQGWLARPANEQAQRAQQLPAALCELRAGTPELRLSAGAVKGTGAISTNNPSGQGARDNWAE